MTRPAGITQAEIERAIRAQVRTGVPREQVAVVIRGGEVVVRAVVDESREEAETGEAPKEWE